MKKIPLTKGKFALVDDKNYHWLMQWKWHLNCGYAARTSNGKSIKMHRLIIGTPHGMQTDHINGNKLDNRRVNLRICNHTQNKRNTKLQKSNNSSGYKGVVKRKENKNWRAIITVNNKQIYLGDFKNKIEAAKVYDKAALTYFGKFAKFNFE